ncbi:hypothetical protein LSTR_LSTR013002 [Laodelphax striatellus]|uniref:Uncharacterized protein n=1 Tax=Laodelphax striatellus TaxID=195883 RepID=A0A482WJ76_LAOST|nr:hypothetical protein LSTR_LSTR013002 [Laodelphax striatellus]
MCAPYLISIRVKHSRLSGFRVGSPNPSPDLQIYLHNFLDESVSFLSQLVPGYDTMNSHIICTVILLLWLSALTVISCLQFPDDGRRPPSPATLESARVAVHPGQTAEEEARIFHQHGIRKKKKKKLKRRLLQCLLSSHFQSHLRQAPPPVDAQGRFIFLNLYDIDINSNSNSNYDDNDDDSYNDNELCGGGGGGGDHNSVDHDTGFGQGINNLGSLVSNNPLGGVLSPSDVVKPVYENPEKFIRKYVIKPLYRTFRPLYRLL